MNIIRLNIKKYERLKRVQFFTMMLLIVISVYIGSNASILHKNLSYIGNTLGHHFLLLIWGTLSAVHFYCSFFTLAHQNQLVPKWMGRVCIIACTMMMLSTIIPYYDDALPLLSFLHLCFAMGSTIAYIACFMLVLYTFQYHHRSFYESSLQGYLIILLLCFLLILTFNCINTASEILFTILLPLYQYYLLKKIEKRVQFF